MSNRHFDDAYIDDLGGIDPSNNYFIPVWDAVFARGIKPCKLLDIACGNGAFAVYARQRNGTRLFGVDGSDYALSKARARGYEQLHHIDDFSADRIEWDDASFDFCLCKDLLEHLVHPAQVVGEASRLLASGGHFLVHVPNHFPLYGRLKFLVRNDIDTFHYFPDAPRWEFPHIRFFTWESLVELARANGFLLAADLSYHFPALPGMGVMPFGAALGRRLARRVPTQFAEAFTLLFIKP